MKSFSGAMRLVLLAGCGAVASASLAHAGELDALKTQLEMLNARVAAAEAAPAVPAGYELVSISKGDALFTPGVDDASAPRRGAHLIGIQPTADAPAGTTISVSGLLGTGFTLDSRDANDPSQDIDNDLDEITKGQLVVKGATETAVGEVGVALDMRSYFIDRSVIGAYMTGSIYFDSAWAYWKATPDLTLGAGLNYTLGKVLYGIDGACICYVTDNADVKLDPGARSQMRLSYAAGPIGFDLAVEDGDRNWGGNELSYAGRVTYSSQTVNGSLNGWYLDDENHQVGAGAGFGLGPVQLSLGAATGVTSGQDFTTLSGLAMVILPKDFLLQAGVGHRDYETSADVTSVMGGIYYYPVHQVMIGLEGERANYDGQQTNTTIGLASVFFF